MYAISPFSSTHSLHRVFTTKCPGFHTASIETGFASKTMIHKKSKGNGKKSETNHKDRDVLTTIIKEGKNGYQPQFARDFRQSPA